jgi:hypothetical protein
LLRRLVQTGLVGLLGILAAGPGWTATMLALGDPQLVALAQAIVMGRAEEVLAFVSPDGRRVETSVRFRVEDVLKGPRDLPAVLEIRIPGGVTETLVTTIPGSPRLEGGERAIVFLGAGPDGEARILALSRGKYGIRRDPETGEDMVVLDSEGLVQLETGLGPGASFLMVPSPDGRVWLEDFLMALRQLIGSSGGN